MLFLTNKNWTVNIKEIYPKRDVLLKLKKIKQLGLLSWNLHTRPLSLLMENVTQSLAHFSQLEHKSGGAQPRRFYENSLRGINSACREGLCRSYLPDQSHLSATPLSPGKDRERPLLEVSWRTLQSRYRTAFYHFMESGDMFKNGCVLPRMSKIILIILSEAHFESSACLQK